MGRYGTPDEDRSAASRSPTGQADRPARQSVLPQSTVGVQSLTHLHATVGPTFERVQVDRGWPGTRPESLHPRTVAGSLSSRIRRHRGSPKRANSRRGTLCFWSPAQLDCDPHVGRAPVRDPRAAATRSRTSGEYFLGLVARRVPTAMSTSWSSSRRARSRTGASSRCGPARIPAAAANRTRDGALPAIERPAFRAVQERAGLARCPRVRNREERSFDIDGSDAAAGRRRCFVDHLGDFPAPGPGSRTRLIAPLLDDPARARSLRWLVWDRARDRWFPGCASHTLWSRPWNPMQSRLPMHLSPRCGVGARKQVFVAALAIVTAEGA